MLFAVTGAGQSGQNESCMDESFVSVGISLETNGNFGYGVLFPDEPKQEYLSTGDLEHSSLKNRYASDGGQQMFSDILEIKNEMTNYVNSCHKQLNDDNKTTTMLSSDPDNQMLTFEEQKSYLCLECPKKFKRVSGLNRHMSTHTSKKLHTCTECNKKFSQSGDLKQHMVIHTGERPYTYTACSKRSQSGSLKIHMRIHSGEKPYSCQECSKASFLVVHLRNIC